MGTLAALSKSLPPGELRVGGLQLTPQLVRCVSEIFDELWVIKTEVAEQAFTTSVFIFVDPSAVPG